MEELETSFQRSLQLSSPSNPMNLPASSPPMNPPSRSSATLTTGTASTKTTKSSIHSPFLSPLPTRTTRRVEAEMSPRTPHPSHTNIPRQRQLSQLNRPQRQAVYNLGDPTKKSLVDADGFVVPSLLKSGTSGESNKKGSSGSLIKKKNGHIDSMITKENNSIMYNKKEGGMMNSMKKNSNTKNEGMMNQKEMVKKQNPLTSSCTPKKTGGLERTSKKSFTSSPVPLHNSPTALLTSPTTLVKTDTITTTRVTRHPLGVRSSLTSTSVHHHQNLEQVVLLLRRQLQEEKEARLALESKYEQLARVHLKLEMDHHLLQSKLEQQAVDLN